MTEIAVETFRPVRLNLAVMRGTPALENVRDALSVDLDLPWRYRRHSRRLLDEWLRMANGKSAYLSEKVKNEVLGAVAYAAPANVFFGIWTTAAGTDLDAYVGNTAGEVTGGAYDRVSKANNTTNFASVTGDAAKVNSNAITWTTATADWNGGATVKSLLAFDGNLKTAADNLLVWGDFTVAKSVLNGDTAQVNTASFSWSEE